MNKVNIDQNLISELEALSKIELSEEERQSTLRDFEKILDYMNILSSCDTSSDMKNGSVLNSEEASNLRSDEVNKDKVTSQYIDMFTNKDISVPEVI
ncbi:MAG: Asp-tRNA(Asn)/Glu-tRNA(Gln) amidotransferase subunit GatC [Clostridia bacterium]|nr:Asp-tRNA(Asn)/Glu-tRNA(Gln) amidotransferase subunit GatC [Clostridia bacterium]